MSESFLVPFLKDLSFTESNLLNFLSKSLFFENSLFSFFPKDICCELLKTYENLFFMKYGNFFIQKENQSLLAFGTNSDMQCCLKESEIKIPTQIKLDFLLKQIECGYTFTIFVSSKKK